MPDFSPQQPSREWWAQRWIDVLESFGFARRLARARTYAREGNVLSIEFKQAKVIARVQGTAPDPYKVTLSLDPFSDEQWGYVVESMSQRAIFSAKLLAGEMPQAIEEVFTGNGLSLFPFTKFDIHSRCSCPDPANPCKHIGAVYYLLGDRFSEDPFVLFQLRGRSKDQIIESLRQIRSQTSGDSSDLQTVQPTSPNDSSPLTPHPSPLTLDSFWQYTEQLEPSLVVIAPPPSSETVLDVLGEIPLKIEITGDAKTAKASASATMKYFKDLYQTVSQAAILVGMTIYEPKE
jgi:uncharacterized Zn finger protein